MNLRTDDFDYQLPSSLIAQRPMPRRGDSRLMVVDRSDGSIQHDRFDHISNHLRSPDVLVANRTRVVRARLRTRKDTGGAVEMLLLKPMEGERWLTLARPSRKLRSGLTLRVEGATQRVHVETDVGDGRWVIRVEGSGGDHGDVLDAGEIPLPPYIKDTSTPDERYQTVYADREGSIAAPTAGLHFSPKHLAELSATGIKLELVTLHVGPGTFKTVAVHNPSEHRMDPEWGEMPAGVALSLNAAREAGGRIVAVGTTTTRLLESAVHGQKFEAFEGETDRFIFPGYQFKAIDALVTNFHLPRSTLLMLVSAFAGYELMRKAYSLAIEKQYRFYSFGDAMLIV